jgi:hypothetical protein
LNRPQANFRFTSDPDPRYCASAFCRLRRTRKATHVVSVGGKSFGVCRSCSRPWESVRGAQVTEVAA